MKICLLLVTQITVAYAEMVFIERTEGQSLGLSLGPLQTHDTPTSLHLYRSRPQSQTTLLSMVMGKKMRVSHEHQGRLEVSGEVVSPQVNVTISQLGQPDTGLYTWEFTYRTANWSDQAIVSSQQVFLFVVSAETCGCSSGYRTLLYTISTAVGLLLLLPVVWLGAQTCARLANHQKPQLPVPIYEEMNSKQKCGGRSKNSSEGPSHLEEAGFPVYANANIRQAQDNHYACPRQIVPCRV